RRALQADRIGDRRAEPRDRRRRGGRARRRPRGRRRARARRLPVLPLHPSRPSPPPRPSPRGAHPVRAPARARANRARAPLPAAPACGSRQHLGPPVPSAGSRSSSSRHRDEGDLLMSAEPYPNESSTASLSSRRGIAILTLLSMVQFMDILDASILNIALPSIKNDLGFSQQSLQWVVNGYILTYGGFLLLGGRMADLLGRRLVMVTGLIVFAGASLTGGLAHSESLLIGARFAQGLGAAMLSPAALSSLTSTFRSTRDRNTALGTWAAVSGIGGAAGVLFGGLLTEGPGWRWVLFVNVPFSAVALVGALALLKKEPMRFRFASFDAFGALLVTGGMLLLVHALVKAPDVGWGATRTIVELSIAGVTLVAFVANELRVANPLVPLSILRVRGGGIADAPHLV